MIVNTINNGIVILGERIPTSRKVSNEIKKKAVKIRHSEILND